MDCWRNDHKILPMVQRNAGRDERFRGAEGPRRRLLGARSGESTRANGELKSADVACNHLFAALIAAAWGWGIGALLWGLALLLR